MAQPNTANVAAIAHETDVLNVTTTPTNITDNPGASDDVYIVKVLKITNVDGSVDATIDASVYRSSTEYPIAFQMNVPAGSSINLAARDEPIYLEEGDALRLTASANGDLTAVCCYDVVSD